jgi:hypothetical protein
MQKTLLGAVFVAIAAPALASPNVNTLDNYTGLGTPYDGVFPFVNVSPGTTANGPTIAAGNINIITGQFEAETIGPDPQNGSYTTFYPDVTGTVTITPVNYFGARHPVSMPLCFAEFQTNGTVVNPSYAQNANGDWQVTFSLQLSNNNPALPNPTSGTQGTIPLTHVTVITTAMPPPPSWAQDPTNHQLDFWCLAKGPSASALP